MVTLDNRRILLRFNRYSFLFLLNEMKMKFGDGSEYFLDQLQYMNGALRTQRQNKGIWQHCTEKVPSAPWPNALNTRLRITDDPGSRVQTPIWGRSRPTKLQLAAAGGSESKASTERRSRSWLTEKLWAYNLALTDDRCNLLDNLYLYITSLLQGTHVMHNQTHGINCCMTFLLFQG